MSLTASRPCLSCHTGSSLGCEAPLPQPPASPPLDLRHFELQECQCWARCFPVREEVAEFYQYIIRHPSESQAKCVQEVDVSHQRWGEASPSCSQNEKAEKESEAFLKWRSLISYDCIVDPTQFSIWDVPASRRVRVLTYHDPVFQYECAQNRSFPLPGDRLLFVGCQRSSSCEHLKAVTASLYFQGEGVAAVSTNCDITKSHLCLGN